MSRELLLDLLVAAAVRPHSRCLRRQAVGASQQVRHYALAGRRKDGSPPASQPSDPLLRPRKASQVPLAVGIDRNPTGKSAISKIPIPKGVKDEHFIPQPLARPLGLSSPPQPGQNSPLDNRTWSQRKADFQDPEQIVERRQVYLRTFLRPYFQEWKRLDKDYKGKSFVANERLFRKDKALYFPNIWGQTLAKEGQGPDGGWDTTPKLKGKISIVGIQQGVWAEEQVKSFLSKESNPELSELLEQHGNIFQRADINVQADIGRAWIVKLFTYRLRNSMPEEMWDRYFMIKLPRDVRRGLTDEIRDAMGFLNTQVGYVYLLDTDCKIRWAGSGHAWKEELESLNNGIKRLLEETKSENLEKQGISYNSMPDVRLQNIPNPPGLASTG